MHDYPRIVKIGNRTIAKIPGALRGAAGEDDHIARRETLADEARQDLLVIGPNTQQLRDAARLLDGSSEDRRIRIVHGARPHRFAGRDDLIAGRDDRNPRSAPYLDHGVANRRQHPDLARGQHLPRAQYGLATRQIAAGEGDELTRSRGTADLDQSGTVTVVCVGMFDHHHRIGAARYHSTGRDQGRRAASDRKLRLRPRESIFRN